MKSVRAVGDVKKGSEKIQVVKRDHVCVLLSTHHIKLYLKRTYKELGYTTEVELANVVSDASVSSCI